MAFLILFILGPLAMLAVFLQDVKRGQIRVSISGWLILFVGYAISFPVTWSLVLSWILEVHDPNLSLSPWLEAWVWRYFWVFLLGWALALTAAVSLKFISFTGIDRRRTIRRFILLMVGLSLPHLALAGVMNMLNTGETPPIAVAVSPDLQRKVEVHEIDYRDASYELYSSANHHPILTRRIGGAGEASGEPAVARLTWSKDSKVVSLWLNGKVEFLHDYSCPDLRKLEEWRWYKEMGEEDALQYLAGNTSLADLQKDATARPTSEP